jgi:hypothetical protein
MFVLPLKTLLTRSWREVFSVHHPTDDFKDLHVSIEFPIEEAAYPGIWVDFEPTAQLETAGIDHQEHVYDEDAEAWRVVQRWRFAGWATFTCTALSSGVRDRLFDEMVKVIAFGNQDPERSKFRDAIENNDLIGTDFDWDQIRISGFTATPGTPWGTNDVVYEATLNMECVGEFVSMPGLDTLVPLSGVEVVAYTEEEGDPTTDGGWL